MTKRQPAITDEKAEGLVRVSDAAVYLALSRSKIYALMDAGDLPYVKIGKSRRLLRADLLNLVERHTIGVRGTQEPRGDQTN